MSKVGQIERATQNRIVQLFQQQLKFDYWGNRKNEKATATNNLHVKNPCPFVPTSMNKNGSGFFCKSCSKTIVDFRGKTADEIGSLIKEDTCGIFTLDQLPGQQPMKPSTKLFFYCLTILSFLGFTIKPLSAQTTLVKKDTVLVEKKYNKQDTVLVNQIATKKADVKHRKKGLFRSMRRRRVTGCPAF